MPHPDTLTLVDLVALAVLVLGAAGAVRRGAGLLPAAVGLVTTALLLWLVVSALAVWGPRPIARAAEQSRLLHTLPAPVHALAQAERLWQSPRGPIH